MNCFLPAGQVCCGGATLAEQTAAWAGLGAGCGARVRRRDLELHRQHCPEAVVDCDMGCSARMKRTRGREA